MSWPDDGGPRFVMTTVSGYLIVPGSGRGSGHPSPSVAAQVIDRAYCDRLLAEFIPGQGWQKGIGSAECIRRAEQLVEDLNRKDQDGEGLA